jgi:site-specific DNA-cytosine methylase
MRFPNVLCSFAASQFATLSTNYDLCLLALRALDLGYEVRSFLLNCEWFGLPQSRLRVYLIGVRAFPELADQPTAILDQTEQLLRVLYLEPPLAVSTLHTQPKDVSF